VIVVLALAAQSTRITISPKPETTSLPQALPTTPPNSIYLRDDSDWWSPSSKEGKAPSSDEPAEQPTVGVPEAGDVARFSILGVSLSKQIDWLRKVENKLGKAEIVERGDGASGREQLCYRSLDGEVELIFEHNEVF
jgi:hypothetical protein